jgi:hypothetical protein
MYTIYTPNISLRDLISDCMSVMEKENTAMKTGSNRKFYLIMDIGIWATGRKESVLMVMEKPTKTTERSITKVYLTTDTNIQETGRKESALTVKEKSASMHLEEDTRANFKTANAMVKEPSATPIPITATKANGKPGNALGTGNN